MGTRIGPLRCGAVRTESLDALAELERVALFAQVTRGLLPEWASRPMLPHEVRAGINFADIDRSLQAGYASGTDALYALRRALTSSLARALGGAVDGAVIAARVAEWVQHPPRDVTRAVAAAKTDLHAALLAAAAQASTQLLNEAAYQGVAAGRVVRGAPELADEAALPVEALLGLVTQAAVVAGLRPAAPDSPLTALDNASLARVVDAVRQAVHIAHGEGRASAAMQLPPPTEIYSSELLDDRTCAPCEAVDGTTYATMTDALTAYPNQGPYRNCLGGARCRGTLIFVWGEDTSAVEFFNPRQARDSHGRWTSGTGGGSSIDTAVDHARTTPEIVKVLQDHIGTRGFISGFTVPYGAGADTGVHELDPERVRDFAKTAATLYDRHPTLQADLGIDWWAGWGTARGCTTGTWNASNKETPGTYDLLHTDWGKWEGVNVTLDPRLFAKGSLGADQDQLWQTAAKAGWFHETDPAHTTAIRDVVTHELGHALDFGGGTALHNQGALRKLIEDSDEEWVVSGKNTSGYGATDHTEMIAEAFADVELNGAKAFPLSKKIHQALTTRVPTEFFNPHQPRDVTEVSR